jgi:hypothetical protein
VWSLTILSKITTRKKKTSTGETVCIRLVLYLLFAESCGLPSYLATDDDGADTEQTDSAREPAEAATEVDKDAQKQEAAVNEPDEPADEPAAEEAPKEKEGGGGGGGDNEEDGDWSEWD